MLNKGFIALSLATLGLAISSTAANAFSIGGYLNGEPEFEALNEDIAWAAESRIGIAGAGDYEIDIHNSDFSVVPHQEFNWVNGQAVDFSLVFDGIDTLTYTVGDVGVSQKVTDKNFSDLLIRTTARINGTSITVDNLKLTDSLMSADIDEVASFACTTDGGCGYNNSSQYLQINDIAGAFNLTGTSTMFWEEGNKPTRSRLAYQLKLIAGDPSEQPPSVDVPEPATVSLLSLGVVGMLLTRTRRRKQDA